MEPNQPQTHHFWKGRLYVSLVMLILAFLGFVVMQISRDNAWHYWRIMAIVYALLSLGFSWYCQHYNLRSAVFTIWHELFHWLGLLLSIFLITYFVDIGLVGRYVASLEIMVLIAFATFLIGVYIEKTFLFVGLLIGAFSGAIGFVEEYLYNIMLPVMIIVIIAIIWMIRHKSKSR